MLIKRHKIQQLTEWKESKQKRSLILDGARQVGKTSLIKEFGSLHFPQTHYFNFEKTPSLRTIFVQDYSPQRILKDLSIVLGKNIEPSDLIFFDEIQECSQAITALKYFQEDASEYSIIGAGSLLGVALSETAFPVGKVDHMWLGPCTFEEYLQTAELPLLGIAIQEYLATNLDRATIAPSIHLRLWEEFRNFYFTGGMPKPIVTFLSAKKNKEVGLDQYESTRAQQDDLLTDYQSDFSKHSEKENAIHIRQVFQSAAYQLASVQDENTKKFVFSNVIKGKKSYAQLSGPISWLTSAGLAYRIPIVNQSLHPLKAFAKESSFKLYVFDVGLLAALAGLPAQAILKQDYGTAKGFFAESIVLQGLRESSSDLPVCWAEGTAEVEFLTVLNGDIIPIEVKSAHRTQAKSLSTYQKKYAPRYALKFSANPPTFVKDKKILNLPLYLAWNIRGTHGIFNTL